MPAKKKSPNKKSTAVDADSTDITVLSPRQSEDDLDDRADTEEFVRGHGSGDLASNHNTKTTAPKKKKKRTGNSLSLLPSPPNPVSKKKQSALQRITKEEANECNAHLYAFADQGHWRPEVAAGWLELFCETAAYKACNQDIAQFLKRWRMNPRIRGALKHDFEYVVQTAWAFEDRKAALGKYAAAGSKLGKRRRHHDKEEMDASDDSEDEPPAKRVKRSRKGRKTKRRSKKKKRGAKPRDSEDSGGDPSADETTTNSSGHSTEEGSV